jgi:uncharacterized membrane protein YhaH (DUF805 family)
MLRYVALRDVVKKVTPAWSGFPARRRTTVHNSHPLSYLWPSIEDRDTARAACSLGMIAAFAAALWSGGFALYAWSNDQHVGHFRVSVTVMFILAVVFFVLGIAVRRGSRAAALSGGLLFVLQQGFSSAGIVVWFDSVLPQLVILVGTIVICFVNGVRGAFIYQRLNRLQASMGETT